MKEHCTGKTALGGKEWRKGWLAMGAAVGSGSSKSQGGEGLLFPIWSELSSSPGHCCPSWVNPKQQSKFVSSQHSKVESILFSYLLSLLCSELKVSLEKALQGQALLFLFWGS